MTTVRRAAAGFGLSVLLSGLAMITVAQIQVKRPIGGTANGRAASRGSDPQPSAVPSPTPGKRNERPQSAPPVSDVPGAKETASVTAGSAKYKYEFSQPEFVVPRIMIEHDENGIGTIEFKQRGSDEAIIDPVSISPKTLARINGAIDALKFLDSTESYQYSKDFSHLGNIRFTFSHDGRSREVEFNWTENKNAKVLMDEYRKLGQQFVWIFDISVSRENQPLESPRLLDRLDSLIKRGEISDPHQLEPFLRELAVDEALPLIARNHASRIVARFEKEKKKGEK
ncbi:MAG: hypothetical protein AB7Q37_11945 [Pyrinomonadaceae bacterium]